MMAFSFYLLLLLCVFYTRATFRGVSVSSSMVVCNERTGHGIDGLVRGQDRIGQRNAPAPIRATNSLKQPNK